MHPATQPGPVGDRDALVREHLPLVRAIAAAAHWRRGPVYDAEDLVMAGVCGLLEAANAYDQQRGTPFRAFARPYIRGRIVDEQRRLGPRPRDGWQSGQPVSLDAAFGADGPGCPTAGLAADPDAANVELQEAVASLHAAIQQLPPRQQLLVRLCYLAELTQAEVALHLGISEGTVANSLWKARRTLTRLLTTGRHGHGPRRRPAAVTAPPCTSRRLRELEALSGLPDADRDLLRAHDVSRFHPDVVAALLRVDVEEVRTRLPVARRRWVAACQARRSRLDPPVAAEGAA
jgi:RNA polymerase sigma factor (sigma-70 family)